MIIKACKRALSTRINCNRYVVIELSVVKFVTNMKTTSPNRYINLRPDPSTSKVLNELYMTKCLCVNINAVNVNQNFFLL